MEHRDVYLLEEILDYCDDLAAGVQNYSISLGKIENDAALRGMVAFFILSLRSPLTKK